jgi:hypothetical protein
MSEKIKGRRKFFEGKAARLLSLRKDRGHTMEVELPRVQEKEKGKTSYEKGEKRKKGVGFAQTHRDTTERTLIWFQRSV